VVDENRRDLILILMPPGIARDAVSAVVAGAGWHGELADPLTWAQQPAGSWNVVIIGATILDSRIVRLTIAATRDPRTRVLIIGEDADPQHIADVLQAGADDYLLYPFAPEECLARLRSLVMYSQRRSRYISPLGFMLDEQTHTIRAGVTRVRLANREWEVLEALFRHNGKPVSVDELSQAVWGAPSNTHALASTIHRLRMKLVAHGIDSVDIVTVRGVGYLARVRSAGA
jgi:DNA-binding response OmpR family regulator